MFEVTDVPAPTHPVDEAPVSAELRERAGQNLEAIKQLVQEARESGSLSPKDEVELMQWLGDDVKRLLAEADKHDANRRAFMASGVVNSGIQPTVNAGAEVMTPTEQQSEVAFRQDHGHPSNETATQI